MEQALSFAETFGLKPIKLDCKTESGKNVTLNFLDSNKEIDQDGVSLSNYENLNLEDKDLLKQLVFLLDKFCVSDAAYHELSMIYDDMPRKYLLIQCREDINKIYHIERLPGNKPGAMINLNSELQRMIKFQLNKGVKDNKFQIKFSCDGARVSRISNFVIFSVAILTNEINLSYNQLNTLAVVKCDENYENLRDSCKPLFDQLSEISEK